MGHREPVRSTASRWRLLARTVCCLTAAYWLAIYVLGVLATNAKPLAGSAVIVLSVTLLTLAGAAFAMRNEIAAGGMFLLGGGFVVGLATAAPGFASALLGSGMVLVAAGVLLLVCGERSPTVSSQRTREEPKETVVAAAPDRYDARTI